MLCHRYLEKQRQHNRGRYLWWTDNRKRSLFGGPCKEQGCRRGSSELIPLGLFCVLLALVLAVLAGRFVASCGCSAIAAGLGGAAVAAGYSGGFLGGSGLRLAVLAAVTLARKCHHSAKGNGGDRNKLLHTLKILKTNTTQIYKNIHYLIFLISIISAIFPKMLKSTSKLPYLRW